MQNENLNSAAKSYFRNLIRRKDAKASSDKIFFWKSGEQKYPSFKPASLLSEKDFSNLPLMEFSDLTFNREKYLEKAQYLIHRIQKLQAGKGTSFKRDAYIAAKDNTPVSQVQSSAKGIDLDLNAPDPKFPQNRIRISIAEGQLLQALKEASRGDYKKVQFQCLLSPDTQNFCTQLTEKDCPLSPGQSYREYFPNESRFEFLNSLLQEFIPTLDENGAYDEEYRAPGGHGYFAFRLIHELLESVTGQSEMNLNDDVITSIGNGEDLNSTPPPEVLGWMFEHQIAIVMVTTDKTDLDLKGGQISLFLESENTPFLSILEKAQAEDLGVLPLFEKLGLRAQDRKALFNTNTALFSHTVIREKIVRLLKTLSAEEILFRITPDLIQNVKKIQRDGKDLKRTQLEGAMGSVILNFDRLCREVLNEGVVSFLNIERERRTDFFAPIKTAFDYVLLYHSNRFEVDQNFRLKNRQPGKLLKVSIALNHANWDEKDISTVLKVFEGADILYLDELYVKGPMILKGLKLSGRVDLLNYSSQPLLAQEIAEAQGYAADLSNTQVVKHANNLVEVLPFEEEMAV